MNHRWSLNWNHGLVPLARTRVPPPFHAGLPPPNPPRYSEGLRSQTHPPPVGRALKKQKGFYQCTGLCIIAAHPRPPEWALESAFRELFASLEGHLHGPRPFVHGGKADDMYPKVSDLRTVRSQDSTSDIMLPWSVQVPPFC